jgi:hypothetical protein
MVRMSFFVELHRSSGGGYRYPGGDEDCGGEFGFQFEGVGVREV